MNPHSEDKVSDKQIPAPLALPPRVVLFALRNTPKKKKFFIPFRDSTCQGFPVANLMVDSGCNTTLLPLAEGDIQKLPKYFPPTMYNWSISVAGGSAGSLSAPVLSIYRESGAPMECKFPEVSFTFHLPYLRFHLCSADVEALHKMGVFPPGPNAQIIAQQMQLAATLNIAFGGRRKHGLLGQGLLDDPLYASFQYGPVLAIVEKNFDWSKIEEAVVSLNGKRAALIDEFDREAAAGEKFADLLDEDHDIDPLDDAEDSEFEFCD